VFSGKNVDTSRVVLGKKYVESILSCGVFLLRAGASARHLPTQLPLLTSYLRPEEDALKLMGQKDEIKKLRHIIKQYQYEDEYDDSLDSFQAVGDADGEVLASLRPETTEHSMLMRVVSHWRQRVSALPSRRTRTIFQWKNTVTLMRITKSKRARLLKLRPQQEAGRLGRCEKKKERRRMPNPAIHHRMLREEGRQHAHIANPDRMAEEGVGREVGVVSHSSSNSHNSSSNSHKSQNHHNSSNNNSNTQEEKKRKNPTKGTKIVQIGSSLPSKRRTLPFRTQAAFWGNESPAGNAKSLRFPLHEFLVGPH